MTYKYSDNQTKHLNGPYSSSIGHPSFWTCFFFIPEMLRFICGRSKFLIISSVYIPVSSICQPISITVKCQHSSSWLILCCREVHVKLPKRQIPQKSQWHQSKPTRIPQTNQNNKLGSYWSRANIVFTYLEDSQYLQSKWLSFCYTDQSVADWLVIGSQACICCNFGK